MQKDQYLLLDLEGNIVWLRIQIVVTQITRIIKTEEITIVISIRSKMKIAITILFNQLQKSIQ